MYKTAAFNRSLVLLFLFFLSNRFYGQPITLMTNEFIAVDQTQFLKNGKPYYFIGTNLWYGMNLGIADHQAYRERLIRELDHLHSLGINNLRIMAASEGPDTEPWRMSPALQTAPGVYNENLLKGLDFLLTEMAKRDMYAVVCLNNMWPWSGGFAQYINWATGVPIPYPPPAEKGKWLKYIKYSSRFFKNKEARTAYLNHINYILQRTNSISSVPYKEDPTIMAWQLANEPRAFLNNHAYRNWIKTTAAFIKQADANHLVSIGSEGNAFLPLSSKFKKEHKIKNIDYATMHVWIQNWGWYQPENAGVSFPKALDKAKNYIQKHVSIAKKLQKPIVLEEFGIARDLENYDPHSSTKVRDVYYREIFSLIHQLAEDGLPVAGGNFWAWAGEGRPATPKAVWKAGDDFIGDPPFEYQGWYSVYDTDTSTLEIIKTFAERMDKLGQ